MLLLLRHHFFHVPDVLSQLSLLILVFLRQLLETFLGEIAEDFSSNNFS